MPSTRSSPAKDSSNQVPLGERAEPDRALLGCEHRPLDRLRRQGVEVIRTIELHDGDTVVALHEDETGHSLNLPTCF